METQVCRTCGAEKPIDDFHTMMQGDKPYRNKHCKDCRNTEMRARYALHPRPRRERKPYVPPATKVCKRCGKEKPYAEFRTLSNTTSAYCPPCRRIKYRQHYTADRKTNKPYFDELLGYSVKRCANCKVEKPVDEFPRRASGKLAGRVQPYCFECIPSVRARWQPQKNATARARRKARPEQHRKYRRTWYAQQPEKSRAYTKKWRNAHPETPREQARMRRARRAGAALVEQIDRAAIIARDKGVCYLCGKKPEGFFLTLDHVIPITRGGSHTADNLRVACRSCNCRKLTRLLEELDWYVPQLAG